MTEKSLMEPTKESQAMDLLDKALMIMRGVEHRVTDHDGRIVALEHQMEKEVYITPAQAVALTDAVKQKVREVCGDSYKEQSKIMFPALWRSVKREFGVTQYREIPRIKIDIAIKMVREWKPLNLAA